MDYESPYCEICGHCGDIGCCGIRGFIEEHIKGKTNCKNEDGIVQDLISICEYETEVFKKNDNLNKGIDELIEKYNKRYDPKEYYLDVENTMICEFIKELQKLKG